MTVPEHDPVYKVTIIPRGRALGVTQFLPEQDRYSMSKRRLESSIATLFGGRIAEELIFGTLSTGGSNDLQRATEMARKMVREFGMSERVGPMAWGNGGEVFLGDDLMHTRDYSDVTSRVIDEEVERILRDQEARALRLLREHQHGLAAVAQALIQRETINGLEVARIVDQAYGRPVHDQLTVPSFATVLANGAGHDPEAFPGEAPGMGGGPGATLQSARADGLLAPDGPHAPGAPPVPGTTPTR